MLRRGAAGHAMCPGRGGSACVRTWVERLVALVGREVGVATDAHQAALIVVRFVQHQGTCQREKVAPRYGQATLWAVTACGGAMSLSVTAVVPSVSASRTVERLLAGFDCNLKDAVTDVLFIKCVVIGRRDGPHVQPPCSR